MENSKKHLLTVSRVLFVLATYFATQNVFALPAYEKVLKVKIRNKVGNDFYMSIDDYIQFAPVVEMYIADMLHIQSKNHWFNQSKNLFIANLITTGVTQGLKVTINKKRPDCKKQD